MSENLITWDDTYSVGYDSIDYQHKDLVSMVNDLFEFCKKERGDRIEFFVLLKKAATYAKLHFADEERYMEKANYPALDEHKKEHEKFIATVEDTMEKFNANKAEPVDMANFLKTWLMNHIAISDKKYSPYLAKL